MKIYIKDNLIDMETIKDLKSKFIITYNENDKYDILLNGTELTFQSTTVQCGHWLEKANVNFSDIIDVILCEIFNSECCVDLKI